MPPLTPNMAVAWNLSRARALRGWTQEQAAEKLAPHVGQRWSKATYSAAERSVAGDRVRQFSADDIFAFSRCFDVPVTYFLRPPPWAEETVIGHAASSETTPREDYLDMLFDVGEDATQWVLSEVVPMSAQTTLALRRWGRNFAAMVAHREREVKDLLAVREEDDR